MIEFHAAVVAWFLSFYRPPSRALVAYHMEIGGMPLHDAVGVNCKKGVTSNIKAKGCTLDDSGYVI